MDSRNNTPRNEKQQELIKRLEEIRSQRAAGEISNQSRKQVEELQYEEVTPRKRNKNAQRSTVSRQEQRRMNQRSSSRRRQTSQPSTNRPLQPSSGVDGDKDKYYSAEDASLEGISLEGVSQEMIRDEIHDQIRTDDLTQKKKKQQKDYSSSLLNQLSHGENLAQAIILNEVLSKPIALRYKNR